MQHISNISNIQDMLTKRLVMEQELAHRLMAEFGKGQLYKDLLWAIRRMLTFLWRLEGPAYQALKQCETEASFLLGLKAYGGTAEGALQALSERGSLPLEHCGDLIRFYGEVIDKAAAKGCGVWFMSERAKQIGWRYGGGGEAWRAQQDPTHRALADKGTVWQKEIFSGRIGPLTQSESKGEMAKGGRIRVKAKPLGDLNPFLQGPRPFYDLVPGASFDRNTYAKLTEQGAGGAGANQWVLTEQSTVKKIDMVFGLPFAADISGTTTDTMHFISGYTDLRDKDPIIFMLPLATIVSQYHHSLLEVALAMSLKKIISYEIGFYNTLLPKYAGSNPHPGRGGIVGVLQSFEQHPDNRHILVYYRSGQIGGAFIADPAEYGQFRKLATCDISLWPKINRMQGFPTQGDIVKLMGSAGLRETVALRSSPLIYTPKVLRG